MIVCLTLLLPSSVSPRCLLMILTTLPSVFGVSPSSNVLLYHFLNAHFRMSWWSLVKML